MRAALPAPGAMPSAPAGRRASAPASGEHGAGAAKRPWLAAQLGPDQLALMRGLKTAFGPAGILSPGILSPGKLGS